MSFVISFQVNQSPDNSLTKDIQTILSLTGTLREQTSIVNPVIRVEASLTDLARCNYATILSFRRSYFITDIVSLRTGLCEVSLHTDVLTSFASEIRQNSAVITRQAYRYNLYLNDGSLQAYSNPIVSTHLFPSGFSGHSFVLCVAGS